VTRESETRLRETFVASAPYRVAPLGAHTDHQDGLVMGFATDARLKIRFSPRDDREIRAVSTLDPTPVAFEIGAEGPPKGGYGDHLRGASTALRTLRTELSGLDASIDGALLPGGVASSAALKIAFLSALAFRNDVPLDAKTAARLCAVAERDYLGLPTGPLDPATILYGAPQKLVRLDCREGTPKAQRLPPSVASLAFVVVASGVRRDLRDGLYARRVAECAEAARLLGAASSPPKLRDVTLEDLRRRRKDLDPVLAARAEHVLTENKRVRDGIAALQQGDVGAFFALVDASATSMDRRFDAATPETRLLRELLSKAPGVRAATFCGAGFGGSLMGLGVRAFDVEAVREAVLPPYQEAFPEAARGTSFHAVGIGGGFGVER
jgi:galactokinase